MGHRVVTDEFFNRVFEMTEGYIKEADRITLRNNCRYYVSANQSVKADILKMVNMVEDSTKRKALRCVIENML